MLLETMEERQLLAVLLATDFIGRTVAGNVASNITWTTDGVSDPGDLTAVEGTEAAAVQLAGLFDTAATDNHFAPNLNTDNEDNWSVAIPLTVTASSITVDDVVIDADHFNNTGINQSVTRDTDIVVSLTGSTSGQVATETKGSGLVNVNWTLTFFDATAPIALSNSETWTLTIGTTNLPGAPGNNFGLDNLTVNGTAAAGLSAADDDYTVSNPITEDATLSIPNGATDILANDTGSPLSIISSDAVSAQGASVAVAADGSFVFDPAGSAALQALNAGDSLVDTFGYTISDIVGGGAGSMNVGLTDEVSSNHTTFDLSVFPGKAGYDDGVDTGVFGDGTVLDYRFFNSPGSVFTSYADGGAGLVGSATATNSSGNGENWADVWTTNDPGVNFSGGDAANFVAPTFARSQGITGTIDVSSLASGSLDFMYGSFTNPSTITLTMTGANQTDVVVQHVEDPVNGINKGFITNFTFADAENYSLITYTYTNTDTDGSRARFMGVIIDGIAANGSTDDGIVSVTVNGVNDAPVGVDDNGAVTESADAIVDPTATGNVVTNDTDVDNPNSALTVTEVGGNAGGVATAVAGTYGSVVINANGTFTYALDDADADTQALSRGQKATDTFAYTVSDGVATSTADLVIDILGANDSPVAADDTVAVTEDTAPSSNGNVITDAGGLDTDTDSTGVVVTAVGVAPVGTNTNVVGTHGTLVISDDGSYTYNLDNAAAQSMGVADTVNDAFTYTLSEAGNVAPAITFDTTVEVSDNHSAFDISVFPGKAGFDDGVDAGAFGDGTVLDYRFFHSPGNVLTSYADGGAGIVSTATATNSNGAGESWANLWTTNDPGTDFAGGDPANIVDTTNTFARSQGVSGTVDVTDLSYGSIYFVHGSFRDRYTFDLTMSGAGQADVDMVHTLDPPELQNTGWITHFQFDDAALYDTISYTYTNADTDGSRARFMGLIVDGGGLQTDTAILTVNVNGANDAVTANDDGGEITEMLGPETPASTVVGTVVGNPHGGGTNSPNAGDTADTDIDTNDTLTVQNAGSLVGTFGTAVVDADGDYTYTLGATPAQETELLAVDAGTDVTDTFALTITDSNGGSDTSDLVITIHGVTDVQPPVINQGAGPLSVAMDEDGSPVDFAAPTISATPADVGDTLTWTLAAGGDAVNGTATVTGTGASPTITYSPNANYNGNDSFTVQVSDGTLTATIVVDLTVSPINDAATFSGDTTGVGAENGPAVTGRLIAADAADGMTAPNFTVTVDGGNGVATIDSATGDWIYTPAANTSGPDSFTVRVTDDDGNNETQVISITVAPPFNAPTIFSGDTSGVGAENGPVVTGTLSATDADGMATPNFTVTVDGTNGAATIDANTGDWTYTPAANTSGPDTFTVRATDDNGNDTTQIISIAVNPIVTSPVYLDGAGDVIVDGSGDNQPHRIIVQQASANEIFVRYDGVRYGSFEVSGSAVVRVTGGDGNDRISITNCIDTEIHGGGGNDQINGGSCNDVVFGGDGRDQILLGNGDNWADGEGGNDHISGRGGSDTILGGGGNDTLRGGSGRDYLFGGIGNDRLSGGNGSDLTVGGLGNDRIWSGSGADVLLGGFGNDNLRGGTGDDLIVGGIGSDHLHGERGRDLIHGGTTSLEDDAQAQQDALLNWAISGLASDLGTYDDDGFSDGLNGGGGIDQMLVGADDVDNSRGNDIVTTL
jgi:VCBS repeat-containing protein